MSTMKCCICGNEFEGFGNNPFPLCSRDDYDSRCCNDCDNLVITTRLALHSNALTPIDEKTKLNKGDLVAFVWSSTSDKPTEQLKANGKVLAGYVEHVAGCKYLGTWGDFVLDTSKDTAFRIKDYAAIATEESQGGNENE